ncbi:hypothetical protein NLO83_14565 [Pseudomonas tremae]|nr:MULTISPECIES: hypothetical protein [Pseudomonas syringae group]MCQ3016808.1 hypothetical protein [Pseudomonas tremae]
MTRLLHDLDQQDCVVLGMHVLQGRQVERELVAEDKMESVSSRHEWLPRQKSCTNVDFCTSFS